MSLSSFRFIYLYVLILSVYIFISNLSSSDIDPEKMSFFSLMMVYVLKSIFFDISIQISAPFCLPLAWNSFFHLFTFILYVYLSLKWVSYRFCKKSVMLCIAFFFGLIFLSALLKNVSSHSPLASMVSPEKKKKQNSLFTVLWSFLCMRQVAILL